MSKYYLGVDLGGTNIAAGIVDCNGNILCKNSVKTNLPQSTETIEKNIYSLCHNLCLDNGYNMQQDIIYVGVGTPGSVNNLEGIVKANVNFGYENWEIASNLNKLFNLPIFIDNDANVALNAEYIAGNAKGVENAIMLTLGTGIGGGILINGKIYTGTNSYAAEIGHMAIDVEGKLCNCGRKGCFEQYASAKSLVRDTKDAMINNPKSKLWDSCKNVNDITPKMLFDAFEDNDATAIKIIETYVKYLSCGIINIINIFQPDSIIIGGGLSSESDRLLPLLMDIIDKEEFARNTSTRTKLISAKFKNDAGIIGAALLGVNNDKKLFN